MSEFPDRYDTVVGQAVASAKRLAQIANVFVEFKFNGYEFLIGPDCDVAAAVRAYHRAIK